MFRECDKDFSARGVLASPTEHTTVAADGAYIPSSAVAFSEPTKPCKVCGRVLPITKFEKQRTSSGGRRSKCWSCRNKDKKQANKRWRTKNPGIVRNQGRSIQKTRARLEAKHGPLYGAEYERLAIHNKSAIPHHAKIVRALLPADLQSIGGNRLSRLMKMNKIFNLKPWHIGWNCSTCGIYSDDHRFFDKDHILPRAKGGTDAKSNYQLLCPNCHRKKTLSDGVLSVPASSELAASTPNRVDATSLNNTPTSGKPDLCGGTGYGPATAQDSVES